MIIFNSLKEIQNTDPAVVALGNFDGIHRGHRSLIETATAQAREKGVKSAVFTFQDHPRNVLAGEIVVRNIIYPDVKWNCSVHWESTMFFRFLLMII